MTNRFNKASSPLTQYRKKRKFRPAAWLPLVALGLGLGLSTGCSGLKVCENDSWFGRDKAAHFVGSAMVAAGAVRWAENSTDDHEAAFIGVSTAMTVGTGKELIDEKVRDTCFSWKDLFWDFLGASVGTSIAAAAE